ncbi:pyrroline-5-carboxylate reductase [Neorhodopirellula lusitana]|uniref:pyrroline-5-carboxylate reductase n=1 Tax=Neorhodopirellula lusitana TaxID=445327 RepID=UPI0038513709
MPLPKLTSIGGGQMARALIGGMIRSEAMLPADLTIVQPSAEGRSWWDNEYPDCTTEPVENVGKAVGDAEIVLLAVKPHIIGPVVSNPDCSFDNKLVISIAAGVPLEKLCAGVGHQRVVRVMPNTPSLVGEGASGFCVGANVQPADVANVKLMLESVGYVAEVTEPQMDAVTGVSGSGPAYIFLLIEGLADGGVAEGLPRKTALALATQTVLGAAKMVRETGLHPGQLKDNVCSPGGTTIAAVKTLEQNAVRAAMMSAVSASANRSRELQ